MEQSKKQMNLTAQSKIVRDPHLDAEIAETFIVLLF